MNQTLPVKVRRSGEPFQVRHLVSSGNEVEEATQLDDQAGFEAKSCRGSLPRYAFGSITVSITWITPFDCLTSAIVTVATLPFRRSE